MTFRNRGVLTGVVMGAFFCGQALAAPLTWFGTVRDLTGPSEDKECVGFVLDGVAEAHPSVPGRGYFAISKTHPGYKEITAMLIAAKIAGTRVQVGTSLTDLSVCGSISINYLVLMPG